MYFWTISVRLGGTYSIKAASFGDACKALGLDGDKCQVISVVTV